MVFSKNKLVREEKTIAVMIEIFCKANHQSTSKELCEDCSELLEYAKVRIAKCPFGADKGPCSKCEIHCYKPDMRERVREVMRFSGPKMLKTHPILAIDHLLKNKVRTDKSKENDCINFSG